jgi:hypothetical protein
MTTEEEWELPQVLEALRWKRQQLADHEAEWKNLRQHSKDLTLRLITKHGYSVMAAAHESGHHRNTIKVWLDLYNAETKRSGQSG